jgi:hypothetical protein
VVGQLGDKLLSAVKYVYRVDKFDDPVFPTQGALTCCSSGGQAPKAPTLLAACWRGASTAEDGQLASVLPAQLGYTSFTSHPPALRRLQATACAARLSWQVSPPTQMCCDLPSST